MIGFTWFRVDDRLIHGQVMVGWVLALGIRKIVLANDEVFHDSWRQETFNIVVKSFAEDVELEVLALSGVPDYLNANQSSRQILLLESLLDVFELHKQGIKIPELNLGGVHLREGREMLLPFLYLDYDEMEAILELNRMGVKIVAQDLPGSKSFDVIDLIKRKRRK